ncbi:MAG: zinc ribbon-containing protein [Thiotrichales bacterium]
MSDDTATDRRPSVYNRMLERVHELFVTAEEKTLPELGEAIQHARDNAVHLQEATREEAHEIADYLRRDLNEMGAYLTDSGRDLRDWLRIDVGLIEARLLDLVSSLADRTRIELDALEQRNRDLAEYQAGEVAGIGRLVCTSCGHTLYFSETKPIPPCPHCQGTLFTRAADAVDDTNEASPE